MHSLPRCTRCQLKHTSMSTSEATKGFLRRIKEDRSEKLHMDPFSLHRWVEVPRELCGLLWNLVLHADQPALGGFSVQDWNGRLRNTSFVQFQHVRLTLCSLRNVVSIMACVCVHEEKTSITNALTYCHKSKYHYVTQICKKIFTGQVNLAWQRVINMNWEMMW